MLDILLNIIGLVGVILVLVVYYFLQAEKMSSEGVSYSLLNLAGAALIMVSLFVDFNLPSAVIQVCWMAISLYGLLKALRKKQEKNNG